jgi:hypothetical protein
MALQAHIPEIAGVIQLAVAPVFLLTAIGTVLAALNARLGRAVDRRRDLEAKLRKMAEDEIDSARRELAVVEQRIRFAYFSILCAVVSALFVCLLIAGAFLGAFVQVDLSNTIGALFVLAMLALVACLLLFLREIFLGVTTPRYVPR